MLFQSSECEPVTFELFVSLDGVGLSLMNNKPEEVANITLSRYVGNEKALPVRK